MNKPRIAGTKFEVLVRDYFRANGWPDAERLALGGNQDRGDLSGVPACVEAKAEKSIDLAGGIKEMEEERARYGKRWGVLVAKRRNHNVADAYAVMPLSLFVEMLRELDGK